MPRWTPTLLVVLLLAGVVVASSGPGVDSRPAVGPKPGTLSARPAGEPVEVVLGTRWSPVEGYSRTRQFAGCLEAALDRPVVVLQRGSYAEANTLIASGRGDVALVCSGATSDPRLREVAEPVWRLDAGNGGTYRSVMVAQEQDDADDLLALRGASIAWADPDSLTGYRAPRARLRQLGEDPDRFFGAASFSHSHDASMEAVSQGFVRVAAVDEEVLRARGMAGLKVVWTSEGFPSPPILVRRGDDTIRAALRALAGRPECLAELGATRLVPADWTTYDSLAATIDVGR